MLSPEGLQALCRARARLRAGAEEPLRIGRLAAESGLSRHHFIRRFKAVFGETPHQVRVRCRLEQAKELLRSSDESITEISLSLGFSSLGTFSARFARKVGVSPSGFRPHGCPAAPGGGELLRPDGGRAPAGEQQLRRSAATLPGVRLSAHRRDPVRIRLTSIFSSSGTVPS